LPMVSTSTPPPTAVSVRLAAVLPVSRSGRNGREK